MDSAEVGARHPSDHPVFLRRRRPEWRACNHSVFVQNVSGLSLCTRREFLGRLGTTAIHELLPSQYYCKQFLQLVGCLFQPVERQDCLLSIEMVWTICTAWYQRSMSGPLAQNRLLTIYASPCCFNKAGTRCPCPLELNADALCMRCLTRISGQL